MLSLRADQSTQSKTIIIRICVMGENSAPVLVSSKGKILGLVVSRHLAPRKASHFVKMRGNFPQDGNCQIIYIYIYVYVFRKYE